jgi:fructose-bisphosphate aldolase class I
VEKHPQKQFMIDLSLIARTLVASGKGILAADESNPTIEKRFRAIDLKSNEESRRAYREMLFTTPALGEDISGIILYDETLRQKATDGTPFVHVLKRQGIIPGIKVDRGTVSLPFSPKEKITEGLDVLRDRLIEYRELGAQFAKWRAVITIGDEIPTGICLRDNASVLARYAALCQEAGLVPIVEPEVLMDGNHGIERCERVTATTLRTVFAELFRHHVALEQMLLKPNMVLPGKDSGAKATPEEIAAATERCFRQVVPAAVAGIVFLSGGQSEVEATSNLNALNASGRAPWQLSFSFGRALQESALKTWAGHPEKVAEAQKVLKHRSSCNRQARLGQYVEAMETQE